MSEHRIFAKCAWRLIPFMGLLYVVSFIDRANVGFAAVGQQAKGAEFVVAEAGNLFIRIAVHDRNDVTDAEALLDTGNAGQDFLGDDRGRASPPSGSRGLCAYTSNPGDCSTAHAARCARGCASAGACRAACTLGGCRTMQGRLGPNRVRGPCRF